MTYGGDDRLKVSKTEKVIEFLQSHLVKPAPRYIVAVCSFRQPGTEVGRAWYANNYEHNYLYSYIETSISVSEAD